MVGTAETARDPLAGAGQQVHPGIHCTLRDQGGCTWAVCACGMPPLHGKEDAGQQGAHTTERKCCLSTETDLPLGLVFRWAGLLHLVWYPVHSTAGTFEFLRSKEPEKHSRDQQDLKTNSHRRKRKEKKKQQQDDTWNPSAKVDFFRKNEVSVQ